MAKKLSVKELKKNINISKQEQSKEFSAFLHKLPDENLLEFVKTQRQMERWLIARGLSYTVGDCFKARFCQGDDPIFHLKDSKTTEKIYQLIWKTVDIYESLWSLVQISFNDIKEFCEQKNIDIPFFKAWDLFLEIVKCQENETFKKCLEPSCNTFNLKRDSTASKLIRKSIWSSLSEEEKAKLDKLTEEQPVSYWLRFVYSTCKELSKSDSLIAEHYNSFRKNIASTTDIHVKVMSDSSKGRLDGRLTSTWWINGEEHKGQEKGGLYLESSVVAKIKT